MVDRLGATVSPTCRLRVAAGSGAAARCGRSRRASRHPGVWTWFDPGVIGVLAVAPSAGAVGAAILVVGVVLAALGAARVVGSCPLRRDRRGRDRRVRRAPHVAAVGGDRVRPGRRRSPVRAGAGALCPAWRFEAPGEVWPLRPLATMRTSGPGGPTAVGCRPRLRTPVRAQPGERRGRGRSPSGCEREVDGVRTTRGGGGGAPRCWP